MLFEWKDLKSEEPEIQVIDHEDEGHSESHCHSYTPDCGSIKKDEKCQCGEMKTSHATLCNSCHSILPNDLQEDVDWCPEAYKNALAYLNEP